MIPPLPFPPLPLPFLLVLLLPALSGRRGPCGSFCPASLLFPSPLCPEGLLPLVFSLCAFRLYVYFFDQVDVGAMQPSVLVSETLNSQESLLHEVDSQLGQATRTLQKKNEDTRDMAIE